jgi:PAS domain S-box-containing protein
VRYVIRTRESVIIDDARRANQFAGDEYLIRRQPRSVFCLPLVRQGAVAGVLYLENTLMSHVFTPDRTALLSLLASQLAISLENTRLYSDLREGEAKIQRLVDANVVGIIISDLESRMIEANDAFLQMVGYAREDLVSGRLHWTDLTPSEWHGQTLRALAELNRSGSFQPYEKEYFRKDGTRVPVLVGGAAFGDPPNQAVAFVVDLSERKQAEAVARESDQRHREMQMELAHANRLAIMGQLTASIAHEVTQPIAATMTNAHAALRWLGGQTPDVGEVRQALGRIVKDGERAGEVVGRIRDLIKKVPPRKDRLQINETIREVLDLAHSEAAKNSIALQTELADDLPPVQGDRVELQQVLLNLIINAVEALASVSDGPREVLISSEKSEADSVLVAVRDSGPGLAPASLDRLFEAFYTTKSSGLGLGLSICRSIIEAHGGRLWASANAPRGAVFQFAVPIHRDSTT